jgi:N-acetyl-anhydromuramyl-L-alanine amidase AmpD
MTYEYISSPNKSSRKGHQPGGIIAHNTAGGSLNSSVRWLTNQVINKKTGKPYNAQASAHCITGRQGKTIRLVPDNEAAWHAGSKSTKPTLNGKRSLNLWTLGHEICNWGGLRKEGERFYCWPNNWRKLYTGPTPVCVPRNVGPVAENYNFANGDPVFPDNIIEYWEPYTEEAITASIELWKDWIERYQIPRECIAGHEEVDSTRKIDPGGTFPWDRILSEIYPKKESKIVVKLHQDDTALEAELPTRHIEGRTENTLWTQLLGPFCR